MQEFLWQHRIRCCQILQREGADLEWATEWTRYNPSSGDAYCPFLTVSYHQARLAFEQGIREHIYVKVEAGDYPYITNELFE
jgi:hypothetical protein